MSFESAYQRVGEIVVARVRIPHEDPSAPGKARPAVLISRTGSTWTAMGLTTQSRYKTTGSERVPILNWRDLGLIRPCYLWGRTVRICCLDIDRHIGWADACLAASIIVNGGVTVADATTLVREAWPAKAA